MKLNPENITKLLKIVAKNIFINHHNSKLNGAMRNNIFHKIKDHNFSISLFCLIDKYNAHNDTMKLYQTNTYGVVEVSPMRKGLR